MPLLEGGPVHVEGVLVGQVDQAGAAVNGPGFLHAVSLQILDVLQVKEQDKRPTTCIQLADPSLCCSLTPVF